MPSVTPPGKAGPAVVAPEGVATFRDPPEDSAVSRMEQIPHARASDSRYSASAPLRPGLPLRLGERNPGAPLDVDWVREIRVNRSAVERRVDTLGGRRGVFGGRRVEWLLRAVSLMDLTTLSGDDTPGRVRRLCAKARQPARRDLLQACGVGPRGLRVAAVCVYPRLVETAARALEGSGIPVAAVAAGFPHGLSPLPQRIGEIRAAVDAGAAEVDVVVTRSHVLTGRWEALHDEVRSFRDACGAARMKTILATGELATLRSVARASLVCMMAGADFVKTSTGKERVNATLPVGLTMVRMVRAYAEHTGHAVGFKPAGGIRAAGEALLWLTLSLEELGPAWTTPSLLRLGASSLLGDVERELEHHVTGRYSASHRHPMA